MSEQGFKDIRKDAPASHEQIEREKRRNQIDEIVHLVAKQSDRQISELICLQNEILYQQSLRMP